MENYTLCDTYSIPSYEDYKEYCDDNDITPAEEDSNEYWKWVSDMQYMEWDDFKENMKYSKENAPCVITGTLGLWNGRPEIEPVECDTVVEAVEKCAKSCDDIIIKMENGVIIVEGLHHDGRNYFEIRKLVDGVPQEYTDYLY